MITLLLADDHEIVRSGLRMQLEREGDIKVIAEAGDGRTAVSLAQKHKPDIAILDVAMADLNGAEATVQIGATVPKVKVIALSALDDNKTVEMVLEAGASGYVLKKNAFKELLTAIRVVMKGQSYLSPDITGNVIKMVRGKRGEDAKSPFAKLTSREREVVQLVAEGKAVKDIAALLYVGVPTIHTHRTRAMEKLKLRSDAELTKYAIREGLTPL